MHIKQKLEESFFKILMVISTIFVLGSLLLILGTVLWRGLPALDLAMLTQIPQGGYYLGKEGGILNAILGSLCLAGGATIVAVILSLPIALYLQLYPIPHFTKDWIRLSLDILWGIPSIVYGAIGFTVMIFLGMRASLLGGIIVLSLLELPIMVRGTAILLAFGRGIGDAASVLFTAGYTDNLPTSLLRPVASLPLSVFFQLGTPFPAVQDRAYAAALVLIVLVLGLSITSRLLSTRFTKNIIR
jgi:phosphate transport system permease protein